jgi:hypothetical protein
VQNWNHQHIFMFKDKFYPALHGFLEKTGPLP